MRRPKLKPCPFCGGKLFDAEAYFVHPMAKCILSKHRFPLGHIEQWNKRLDLPEPAVSQVNAAIAKADGSVANYAALDTADLDRTRVHLANCIMNCGTRIYEGDKHHVTPNGEFYCSEHAKAEGRS